MTSAWVRPFLGIPYEVHGRSRSGCDCWGLYRLVLEEAAGIHVASYVEQYDGEAFGDPAHPRGDERKRRELADLIRGEREKLWRRVAPAQARPFDGLVFKILGEPVHVATVVDRNFMLITSQLKGSHLTRWTVEQWMRPARWEGIYRHVDLP